MVITKEILLLGCLLWTSRAFSPRGRFQTNSGCRNRKCETDETKKLLTIATDELISEERIQVKDNGKELGDSSCHRLELDDSTGCLRFGDGADVFLKGLDPSLWSSTRPPSGNKSALFLHTSHPKEQPEHQTALGDLISCSRLLACSRLTRYWMGPKVGKNAKDIPFDTQFLLIEIKEDKEYALMLPLVDNGFRASLHCSDDASIEIVCAAESGDAAVTSKGMMALYVAIGDDPFDLVKQGFSNVAVALDTFKTLDMKEIPPSVDDFGWCTWDAFYSQVTPDGVLKGVRALREAGVPPRTLILDDGWQTVDPSPPAWNENDQAAEAKGRNGKAGNSILGKFGELVSEQFVQLISASYEKWVRTAPHGSVRNKVWTALSRSVLKNGLWQFFDSATDFNRQLSGFEANFKFEMKDDAEGVKVKTLKGLVTELKSELGVKNVFCWHALHGYWRGVSEELGKAAGIHVTNIFPKPSQSLLKLEPQSAWDPVSLFGVGVMTTKSDLEKFYELLHTPLVEAGVDGVKVDVQSGVSAAGDGVGGGPHISKLYTKAMEASVSKRFPALNGAANCLNCMCHSTENLYRHKATSVARASEDFFPGRPETHTVHLVNVAYNSLFIGEICLPDWDMFHSKHESAGLHAAARAIGGCPVYVSDKPGHHDPQLLKKLVLPDGSVLRAKLPGRPTKDCLFVDVTSDESSALKIWNMNSIGGVVGAFNVQGVAWNYDTHDNQVLNSSPRPVLAEVKPHDIETLRKVPGPFAAWRHRSSSLEFLPKGDSVMKVQLDHRDWEIFSIIPIQMIDNLMWAPIGLSSMMNCGGAVSSTQLEKTPSSIAKVVAKFESRGPGRFVAFTNTPPSRVFIENSDNTNLLFLHDDETGELSFELPSENEGIAHKIRVEWD